MFGKHRSVSAALSGGKKSVGSFYNVKIKNLLPAYSFLFGWQLSRIVRPRRGEHHWDLSIRGGASIRIRYMRTDVFSGHYGCHNA